MVPMAILPAGEGGVGAGGACLPAAWPGARREYLQPLVVAGDAALSAADAVDRAPSTPPAPPPGPPSALASAPLGPGERTTTGLAVVGGIDAVAAWPLGPGDAQVAEVAARVAALAEALATRLLAAVGKPSTRPTVPRCEWRPPLLACCWLG